MALYVRMHTGWLQNKHMVQLTPAARLLYFGGLAYSVENLSDGHIPKQVLRRIADVGDKMPQRSAQLLVKNGRWIDAGSHWIVANYHDPEHGQSVADDVQKKRDVWREKQRKRRGLTDLSPRDSPGDSPGESPQMSPVMSPDCLLGVSHESPYIEPEPEPEPLVKPRTKNQEPFPATVAAKVSQPAKRNLAWEAAQEQILAGFPAILAASASAWAGACAKGASSPQNAGRRAFLAAHLVRLNGLPVEAITKQSRAAFALKLDAGLALNGTKTMWETQWRTASQGRFWPDSLAARFEVVINSWPVQNLEKSGYSARLAADVARLEAEQDGTE